MPRLSGAARTEALRAKREALDKKLREAEAQDRAEEKEQTRRRHEIAGRVALAYAEANPHDPFARTLAEQLAQAVTKPGDRALFPALALAAPESQPASNPPAVPAPADSVPA
jgi:hypothetical protein